MSEPNPYEPPREPEPLTTGKVVKRGLGFAVILALTPLAGFLTFFVTCLVAISTMPIFPEPPPESAIWWNGVFYAVTLVPTGIAILVMLIWAIRARQRQM